MHGSLGLGHRRFAVEMVVEASIREEQVESGLEDGLMELTAYWCWW